MDRQPVSSSNIRSIGYRPENHVLELEFYNGRIYRYAKLPNIIYRGLLRAASKGGYFNRHIKDHYPTSRIK